MKVHQKNIDICSGPLFSNILKFAFPLVLTALFQRLYNAADVVIVGRYAGQEALAGVGTTGSLTTLMLNLFTGLSIGVSVVLGNAIGAKNENNITKIVHTAIALSILGGAFISVFGIVFAEPLLNLIDVPYNVMPHAKIYLQITFAGQIPSLVFNFGSSILRSKGDTKRPLFIVSISGIINVVLNIFFVTQLGMKADGVALATVISQIFTAVAIIYLLCNETDTTRLYLRQLRIYKRQLADIVKIGVPSGIQGMIFSLSNVIIQSTVNGFGSAAIAGSSAASNIGGFYYISLHTLSQATVTFVSQNMGAKRYDRVKKTVMYCLLDVVIIWIVQALITLFASEFLISIYSPGDTEAIKMGVIRLTIVGCTYGLCGLMEVMCGALRGMGYSLATMLISIAGVCGIRILWIFTVFKAIRTFESLFVSFPLSWFGTFAFHTIMFLYYFKKHIRETDKHLHADVT